MPEEAVVAQGDERAESLTAQVNVRVTESEKLDVRLLAAFYAETESAILRERSIHQIVQRAREIRTRDIA